MKAIIMSVQPHWLKKILIGEKTIEIRKSVPKNFKGWVYLYCTKKLSGRYIVKKGEDFYGEPLDKPLIIHIPTFFEFESGGKVLARFWLDEWEEIIIEEVCESWDDITDYQFMTYKLSEKELLQKSCLSTDDIIDYAPTGKIYVWYIKSLQIFDKPKELHEFKILCRDFYHGYFIGCDFGCSVYENKQCKKGYRPLTKAPQSWCYVEDCEK